MMVKRESCDTTWQDVPAAGIAGVCAPRMPSNYTTAFGDTLTEKLGKPEAPVCERHKPAFTLKVKAHFIGHE